MLDKTLESTLDFKEIQPIHPKGNQSWKFIGKTDVEAETPILWPPDAKNWLLKRPWCWKRLKAQGEGDDRGWDGWMASPTQWTWVWINCGSTNSQVRQGGLACCPLCVVANSRTQLSDWTEGSYSFTHYCICVLSVTVHRVERAHYIFSFFSIFYKS